MASDALQTIRDLGLDVPQNAKGEFVTDCPFCDKEGHLYINTANGLWQCHRCGRAGNAKNFLGHFLELCGDNTGDEEYQKLSEDRGLKVSTLQEFGWVYDGHRWYLPVYDADGKLATARWWVKGGRLKALAGLPVQLFNGHILKEVNQSRTVWICEGEWDAQALTELLLSCKRDKDIVVATPGASVLKKDWASLFMDMRVIICSDNDQAGDNAQIKIAEALDGFVESVRFVNWLYDLPAGFDIRDHVLMGRLGKLTPQKILQNLEDMIAEKPRLTIQEEESERDRRIKDSVNGDVTHLGEIASFQDVLRVFDKWMEMDDDLEGAITISLATALSNELGNEPLWFYLIAPPASGKTAVLMALQDSSRTIFRSTLTPASLVSGFNAGHDPSLLPKLNGKCAIFKDGTELLALHPDARREIYGTLRGAFDGYVYKQFGNGITREYTNLHFNVIVGVTPAIHGDNNAMMGERFLKYEMRDNEATAEAKIIAAITNTSQNRQKNAELNEVCKKYLRREINDELLPPMRQDILNKIVAMSQFVSIMRAQVSREGIGYERSMAFRPTHELGTRIAIQLTKLARTIAFMYEVEEVDDSVYHLIYKVGLDTTTGFHMDVVETSMTKDPDQKGMSRDELRLAADMTVATLSRRLEDLEDLRVVERIKAAPTEVSRGPRGFVYRVAPVIARLWRRIQPEGFSPSFSSKRAPILGRRGRKLRGGGI